MSDAKIDAPICRCGLAMVENPHPDAGKPFTLCEIGAVWVCVPCMSFSLHRWCGRALDAEKKLAEIHEKAAPPQPPTPDATKAREE